MKMTLCWPLFGLVDEAGNEIEYACLNGPSRNADERSAVETIARQMQLIGFTSYLTFPSHIEPGDHFEAATRCRAWCHCFHDPDRYLPSDRPRTLLSYSDFTDISLVSAASLFPHRQVEKRWDFVYVCQDGPWKEWVKNWDLARKCLPILCRDLQLTGILVGRAEISNLPAYSGLLTVCSELTWRELMYVFLRSRFLFVPNELDPSPRIITEALCMGTPVLVNRHILGGWKYVNPFTGAFFESVRDVAAGARYCLQEWTSPRRWFGANHGPLHAGTRLARFVAQWDPKLQNVRTLRVTYEIKVRHDTAH